MSGRNDRRWSAAAALSLAVHAGLILALRLAPEPPLRIPVETDDPPPLVVALVPPPEPPKPEGGSPGPPIPEPEPAPPKPAPPKPKVALHKPKTPPPPTVRPLPAAPTPEPDPGPDPAAIVSGAELAGAIVAGGGGGSGSGVGGGNGAGAGCDMVQRLQAALRADPDLRAAAFAAQRKASDPRAIRIWNGDWIRGEGQEGKGLAGLRQAIIVEVGFAPEACRNQAMRGLVLITFADGPGAPRIALGQGSWRWTDLLGRRRG